MTDIEHKRIQNLTGSIILNQLALNHNEKLKYTKFYKHNLKKTLNLTIKELIKAEEKEFDLILEVDDQKVSNISANVLEAIELMMQKGFITYIMLSNMVNAYDKNPKAIEGIINKVLNK